MSQAGQRARQTAPAPPGESEASPPGGDVRRYPRRDHADEQIDAFVREFSPKYDKAVDCLLADRDRLLTFFAFPAEHWKHLRTSNVIESPFATVRLRQRVTKGADNRTKALTMAFQLLQMAQQRWRRLDGAHLLPLVRAGVTFVDGVQLERKNPHDERKEAAGSCRPHPQLSTIPQTAWSTHPKE